ncbi:MAG TPA: hypothetical protein VET85_10715 [Stellaceae bacterium]|nr:hypothetical protein [Stellaceae bacterium]
MNPRSASANDNRPTLARAAARLGGAALHCVMAGIALARLGLLLAGV